jgi:hypothetical protein
LYAHTLVKTAGPRRRDRGAKLLVTPTPFVTVML